MLFKSDVNLLKSELDLNDARSNNFTFLYHTEADLQKLN